MDGSHNDMTESVPRRSRSKQQESPNRHKRKLREYQQVGRRARRADPLDGMPEWARKPGVVSRRKREAVYQRDRYRCRYCGARTRQENRSLDHVVPQSRGGTNHMHNLVCACRACNQRKDNRTPSEAGMDLLPLEYGEDQRA